MDNVSVPLNGSSTSGNQIGEFPFWQPALAVTLFSYVFVLGVIVLTLYLPLLVALLKKKEERQKPLNLIHTSSLISVILQNILHVLVHTLYLPSIFRNCECSPVIGVVFLTVRLVFSIYRPVVFASLGVLQLLVILGKKKFVTFKTTYGLVTVSIMVSLVFAVEGIILSLGSDERLICDNCPDRKLQPGGTIHTILLSYAVGSLLPSLIVVIIASTWSCATFKKYYTGGDDQLSRRILSLPIVMPLTIVASTLLEVIAVILFEEVAVFLPLGNYSMYWIMFSQLELVLLFLVATEVTYPLMLICTHPYLNRSFKELTQRFKSNRVAPSHSS